MTVLGWAGCQWNAACGLSLDNLPLVLSLQDLRGNCLGPFRVTQTHLQLWQGLHHCVALFPILVFLLSLILTIWCVRSSLWSLGSCFCNMVNDGDPKYNSLLFTQNWQLGTAGGNSCLRNPSPAPHADLQGAMSAWRIVSNQGPRQRARAPAACRAHAPSSNASAQSLANPS